MKAAYTIGRFQPPTLGHVRMIDAMLERANGAPTFVFVSAVSTYIPPAMKVEYLRKMLTRNGRFPANLKLVDASKCEPPCGGPLGGFEFLKARPEGALVGPGVLLFVGGDRLVDFNPKTAEMWSKVPEEERPTIQALPRVGEGAATFSSTLARTNVDKPEFATYFQDGTNQVTTEDVERLRSVLSKALSKPVKPAKKKGGAEDESVLDNVLDGGRHRARRTRRGNRSKRNRTRTKNVWH